MPDGNDAQLSLIAVPADGSEILFDGSSIAPGIHLRWSFLPELGFPAGGFIIERRRYPKGEFTEPVWERLTTQPLALPSVPEGQATAGGIHEALRLLSDRVATATSSKFAEHYLSDPTQLIALLRSLQQSRDLSSESAPSAYRPRTRLSTLDVLLMASLDPYVARILGLYYIDGSILPGSPVDYKVTGQWDSTLWPLRTVSFDQVEPQAVKTGLFLAGPLRIFTDLAASFAEVQSVTALRLYGARDRSVEVIFPHPIQEADFVFAESISGTPWRIEAANEANEKFAGRITTSPSGTTLQFRSTQAFTRLSLGAVWAAPRGWHLQAISFRRRSGQIGNCNTKIIRVNPLLNTVGNPIAVPDRDFWIMPAVGTMTPPQVDTVRRSILPSALNENGQVVKGTSEVELLCRQQTGSETTPNPARHVRLHAGYRRTDGSAPRPMDVLTSAEPLPWPLPELVAFWKLDGTLRAVNRNLTLTGPGAAEREVFTNTRPSAPFFDRQQQTLQLYTYPGSATVRPNAPGYLEIADLPELRQLGRHLYLQLWVMPFSNPASSEKYPTLIGNNFRESFWLGLSKQSSGYRIRFYVNARPYVETTSTILSERVVSCCGAL